MFVQATLDEVAAGGGVTVQTVPARSRSTEELCSAVARRRSPPQEVWLPVFPYLQTGPWTASRVGPPLAAGLAASILISSLAGPKLRSVWS